MGTAKRLWEEMMSREWVSQGDKYVCASCFDEPAIKEFVRKSASARSYSYCRTAGEQPVAVPLEDVLELIEEGVEYEWTDPAGELPYDGREGGYQVAPVYDGFELIMEDHVEVQAGDDRLREDIAAAFAQSQYCERGWAGDSEQDYLHYSWGRFVNLIKHERRYFFQFAEAKPDPYEPWMPSVPPAKILEDLGQIVEVLDVVRELPRGTRIVRGRAHERNDVPRAAKDLGSPPFSAARFPNRMSPAGVPMFYGAGDEATAIAEIVDDPRRPPPFITTGCFETLRDAKILDLFEAIPNPSLFSDERVLRHKVRFFQRFAQDLSRPVVKDGRIHVEYIPTQVVTEYFRYAFADVTGEPLSGVRYRSSKVDGECFVLFADNEQCVDKGDASPRSTPALLALDKSTVKTMVP